MATKEEGKFPAQGLPAKMRKISGRAPGRLLSWAEKVLRMT